MHSGLGAGVKNSRGKAMYGRARVAGRDRTYVSSRYR